MFSVIELRIPFFIKTSTIITYYLQCFNKNKRGMIDCRVSYAFGCLRLCTEHVSFDADFSNRQSDSRGSFIKICMTV
jgi:hypothetical protein